MILGKRVVFWLDIDRVTPSTECVQISCYNNYLQLLKIYSHKNENFRKYFLVLCSPVTLLKHNIYALFGEIKAVFRLF